MKLKLIFLSGLMLPVVIHADDPKANPAPVVNIIFGNSTNSIESVFSFAGVGPAADSKITGLYRPQFIPQNNGQIKKDAFVFDPNAYARGVGTYPFLFTYKNGFYYLFFSSSKLANIKSEFPFFATVIKVSGLDEKTKVAKLQTITNIDFDQNDTLVIALDKDDMKFYNLTKKTRVSKLPRERKQPPTPTQAIEPAANKPKPSRLPQVPTSPRPAIPQRSR